MVTFPAERKAVFLCAPREPSEEICFESLTGLPYRRGGGEFHLTKHANVWLDDWTRSYVLSRSRDSSELDATMRKCTEDGAREGVSQNEIEAAGGGDLLGYIREAIIRSAGG